MLLVNYLEQHKTIQTEILAIKSLLQDGKVAAQGAELASHINALAGRLKVHLASEDQYLYPELIQKGDKQLSKLAETYQEEMGNLQQVFTQFKDKFNTRSKIYNQEEAFLKEVKEILSQIEQRMEKEEKGIYQHLS